MNTIIQIQILDEMYKFKAEDGVEDARAVGDFLTEEFRKQESSLGAQAKSMSKVAKLLLLTMNIADAYLSLKHQQDEMITAFTEESARILKTLPENI